MTGISFSCPACGASVPVPEDGDPSSCPRCGHNFETEGSSGRRQTRRCLNCKAELSGGETVCPQCGTDQETGKRAFGSGKRREPHSDRVEGQHGDKITSLSTLILLVALGGGIAACVYYLNKSPTPQKSLTPPPRTQARTQPLAPLPTNTLSDAVHTSGVRLVHAAQQAEDPLAAAVARYRAALRQGRLDSAQQARTLIEQRFSPSVPLSEFWRRALAPDQVLTLSIYSACTVCTDGTCPVCHNAPMCATCKGGGICSSCEGSPRRRVPCQECVCQSCEGTGRCKGCAGLGTLTCRACGGLGYTDHRNVIRCESCEGSGKRNGLRTGKGYMLIKCLTCAGTGKITQRIRQPCQACAAQTRVKCPDCSATGRCAACRGTGRESSCLKCGGKSYVEVVCKTCGGKGKCTTCGGIGHCQRCLGSGICYQCRRTGLVREARLPVPSAWLAETCRFVVFDTRTGQVTASGTTPGRHTVEVGGRSVTFEVATNEVVWVSTTPSFQHISRMFAQ